MAKKDGIKPYVVEGKVVQADEAGFGLATGRSKKPSHFMAIFEHYGTPLPPLLMGKRVRISVEVTGG